jgi:hypothetical protein
VIAVAMIAVVAGFVQFVDRPIRRRTTPSLEGGSF